MDEFAELSDKVRVTAAQMAGIDNGWNRLHIASQVLPSLVTMHHRAVSGMSTEQTATLCAHEALTYADALLEAWRKSQGDEYGD